MRTPRPRGQGTAVDLVQPPDEVVHQLQWRRRHRALADVLILMPVLRLGDLVHERALLRRPASSTSADPGRSEATPFAEMLAASTHVLHFPVGDKITFSTDVAKLCAPAKSRKDA